MATTSVRLDGNMDEYSLALAHRVNLLRPPYCLKDPLRLYRDDDDVPDAYLGLWRLDDGEPLVRPRGDDGECDWAELGR